MKLNIRRNYFGWSWYSICSAHGGPDPSHHDPTCPLCQRGHWLSPLHQWKNRRWYKTHWYDYSTGKWIKGKKPTMIDAWDRFVGDMSPDIEDHRREFPSPKADDD